MLVVFNVGNVFDFLSQYTAKYNDSVKTHRILPKYLLSEENECENMTLVYNYFDIEV